MDTAVSHSENLEVDNNAHDLIFLDNSQDKLITLQKKVRLNDSMQARFLFILRANDVNMFQEAFKSDTRVKILDGTRIAQLLILNPKKALSLFSEMIVPIVNSYLENSQNIFIYGEVVDILLENRCFDISLELEKEWTEFIKNKPIQILCGYKYSNFVNPIWRSKFKSVCECHSHIENESPKLSTKDVIELKLSRINFDMNSSNLKTHQSTEIKNSLALIQLASQSIDNILNRIKISPDDKAQIKRHEGHIQTGIQRILDFLAKN